MRRSSLGVGFCTSRGRVILCALGFAVCLGTTVGLRVCRNTTSLTPSISMQPASTEGAEMKQLTPHDNGSSATPTSPCETGRVSSEISRQSLSSSSLEELPSSEARHVLIGDEEFTVVRTQEAETIYFKNGMVRSIVPLVNGKPNGVERSWHPNGRPHSEGQWIGGMREGKWTYRADTGVLVAAGEYQNGLMEGYWTQYSPNGEVVSRGVYHGQLREGWWSYFLQDGSVDDAHSGFYRNDERILQ